MPCQTQLNQKCFFIPSSPADLAHCSLRPFEKAWQESSLTPLCTLSFTHSLLLSLSLKWEQCASTCFVLATMLLCLSALASSARARARACARLPAFGCCAQRAPCAVWRRVSLTGPVDTLTLPRGCCCCSSELRISDRCLLSPWVHDAPINLARLVSVCCHRASASDGRGRGGGGAGGAAAPQSLLAWHQHHRRCCWHVRRPSPMVADAVAVAVACVGRRRVAVANFEKWSAKTYAVSAETVAGSVSVLTSASPLPSPSLSVPEVASKPANNRIAATCAVLFVQCV